MEGGSESERTQRLELILQQVESLPTLPAVAMRLLQVTGNDDSDARQVTEIVQSDPALTSRVLAMCHKADKGVREPVTTVDRAVVLLGFEAIRNAVLSIKVFELFADRSGNEVEVVKGFSQAGFWRHSLAVAVAAELLAEEQRDFRDELNPSEAFVCGLLHDLGKLVLDHLLPKSYERVIEVTEQHQLNISDVERRVIGLDHHTVGKRLAEHWRLPHVLQDCIWLHGAPYQSLPEIKNRRMVGLVGLADLLARKNHLGYSGNYHLGETLESKAEEAGLDASCVVRVTEALHEELQRRAEVIGLGDSPSRTLFLQSIMQANEVLGRLNRKLEERREQSHEQTSVLEEITEFHKESLAPGRNVQDALGSVVISAERVFGKGYYGILYQNSAGQPWLINQYGEDGRVAHGQYVDPPVHSPNLAKLMEENSASMGMMGFLPWIADYLLESQDVREVRLLPLKCRWGSAAVLLHDRRDLPTGLQLESLTHTWGAAIGAAAQHQGARRLGEQLVESNRQLVEAQDSLLENQSMARLGEMAAGAAHEMNNPLAVISGRAQLLASRLEMGSREQQDADQIWRQADRLSDLITALRLFAEPPRPKIAVIAIEDIVDEAIHQMKQVEPEAEAPVVTGPEEALKLRTDGEHLSTVLGVLLTNAAQAEPRSRIRVDASVDDLNDRLMFKVKDDGVGMEAAALEHAFDPFFSAKPAGRRVGIGLAKAKRLLEGLGGAIELNSAPGIGTTAIVTLPLDLATTEEASMVMSGESDA